MDATTGYVGIGTVAPRCQLNVNSYLTYDWGLSLLTTVNRQNTVSYVIKYAGKDRFWVHGSGYIFCHGTYLGSDSTLKTNIRAIDSPLARLLALRGFSYKWKTDATAAAQDSLYKADSLTHYGFLAQQVDSALPAGTGVAMQMHDSNNTYAVAYNEIVPLLVEGIKAQQTQINTISEGGACGNKSFYTAGGCAAFAKTDMLNASSRYLEACTDPTSDARRLWISNSGNKYLKYWDNQSTPVLQTVEILANKDVINGYAGLNSSGKLNGTQLLYGTGGNTACEGNDSRLNDARSGKLNYVDNSTHTGSATTSEEVLASIQIPGGSLGPNDVIEVTISGQHTNNANNKIYRLRWNNANSIGGTIFASKAATTSASFSGYCRIVMKNSTSSQEVNGTNVSWDATGTSTTSAVTASLNTGSDVYILLTSQHSNAGDNQQILNYQIRILKP